MDKELQAQNGVTTKQRFNRKYYVLLLCCGLVSVLAFASLIRQPNFNLSHIFFEEEELRTRIYVVEIKLSNENEARIYEDVKGFKTKKNHVEFKYIDTTDSEKDTIKLTFPLDTIDSVESYWITLEEDYKS